MSYKKLILQAVCVLCAASLHAQAHFKTNSNTSSGYSSEGQYSESGNVRAGSNRMQWGRDTTSTGEKEVPIGVFQWVLDERLGTVIPAENNDTVHHAFQNWHMTYGMNGEYNILGNLGSPRLSRIYLHRKDDDRMLFLSPLSYFLDGLQDFRFTNTLSPITNLAYHKVGSSQTGQDRVRAYFASNINKISGIGFKLDYLYGRGYYNNQANSQFGGTLFGYYRGERYEMHAWVNANHSKMGENGGVEDDNYITDPQSFPQSYSSKDIPTSLEDTWNRNDNQTYYLTHRYNMGYYRELEVPDSLKPQMPSDSELLTQIKDSIRQVIKADSVRYALTIDSLRTNWKKSLVNLQEFMPVSSLIHTLQVKNLHHTFYNNSDNSSYYTYLFYGDPSHVRDKANALSVRNTLGLALREGFRKWAVMNITAYATHELRTYQLPEANDSALMKRYTENNVSVGGEISRTQGKLIHYKVDGEFTLLGEDVGQFDVDGNLDFNFQLGKKDTISLEAHGFVKNENPGFFYRHYHSQYACWDNSDLNKEFKTRIEGTLHNKRTNTAITVGVENVKNYTYFGMVNTLVGKDESSTLTADYTHSVQVKQESGNIQVFSAALEQNLKFGPFCWDNQITYQTSSKQEVLPLPKINVYSNMYLKFCIAKVLHIELGGDVRYWTSYYAPDYAVSIGQFAVQDAENPRIKIGNYPIVNAYINMHLKHCRIYVAMNHINAGSGKMFWAPHYGMDPRTFNFGVSWNFFN